jgi:hypothetical protein
MPTLAPSFFQLEPHPSHMTDNLARKYHKLDNSTPSTKHQHTTTTMPLYELFCIASHNPVSPVSMPRGSDRIRFGSARRGAAACAQARADGTTRRPRDDSDGRRMDERQRHTASTVGTANAAYCVHSRRRIARTCPRVSARKSAARAALRDKHSPAADMPRRNRIDWAVAQGVRRRLPGMQIQVHAPLRHSSEHTRLESCRAAGTQLPLLLSFLALTGMPAC